MKNSILLTVLKIFGAVAGLSAVSYGVVVLLMDYKGIELSLHGHIAAALAIFFTYGVGAALMALLFFSNKHGHDDEVHNVVQNSGADED